MDIAVRLAGALSELHLTGRLIVGADERELVPLRNTIDALIKAGHVDIVIDLSGLTHLDARGLGELAMAMKTVHLAGGRLTLSSPSARVARMLAVTRLDVAFE